MKQGRFSGIRWVFLDVGGVLMDEDRSTAIRLDSLRRALGSMGIRTSRAQVHRAYRKAWMTGSPRPFAGAASVLSGSPGKGWELWKRIPYPYGRDRIVHGAAGVIRALAKAGFRIGILANQPRQCRQKLKAAGLLNHVSAVVISAEVHLEKPDPRIFKLALNKAKCKPAEAVMIGDRIDNDIRPANRIGMRTIRIRTGWGRPQRARTRRDVPSATVGTLRGILRPLGVLSR